jgi:hypothetical protein
MSNCNNTPTLVNCNQGFGCLDIYNTSCIQYDGAGLTCLNIPTGGTLNDMLCSVNNIICNLQNDSGLVIVDNNDTNPGTLTQKLVAGANIVLTGIGYGTYEQIRIDAVLGGQIQDQYVKASATDSVAGFLDQKLVVGPCMYIQKVNPGLNESLQVFIDWNCALNQLSQLPGFCTLVNNCIPNLPTVTCPYIILNNPAITGSTMSASWVSSGVSFNVYIDGILQSNMPTSSLSYSASNLTNGSHTVQVVALCQSGTPQTANQTFSINTVCPVPNSVVATIANGTATLAWSLDTNSNNTNQTIQYKLNTASTWTTATTVSPITTNYSISGLNSNAIYNFQIVNNCSTGGPSASTVQNAIQLTCPVVSLTSTNSTIGFSYPNLGGDVSSYTVTLLNSGTIVQTKTENVPFSSVINDSFSGLTANTAYQVQVTVNAGTFTNACAAQTITTTAIPACPSATNFAVTLS